MYEFDYDHYPENTYSVGNYDTILSGFDSNIIGITLRKSDRR